MGEKDSKPPPAPPKAKWGSYRYQLVTPDGTILARSPSRLAALQSAVAMYGPLTPFQSGTTWELRDDDGALRALVLGK